MVMKNAYIKVQTYVLKKKKGDPSIPGWFPEDGCLEQFMQHRDMVLAVTKKLCPPSVKVCRSDHFLKLRNFVSRYRNGISSNGMS